MQRSNLHRNPPPSFDSSLGFNFTACMARDCFYLSAYPSGRRGSAGEAPIDVTRRAEESCVRPPFISSSPPNLRLIYHDLPTTHHLPHSSTTKLISDKNRMNDPTRDGDSMDINSYLSIQSTSPSRRVGANLRPVQETGVLASDGMDALLSRHLSEREARIAAREEEVARRRALGPDLTLLGRNSNSSDSITLPVTNPTGAQRRMGPRPSTTQNRRPTGAGDTNPTIPGLGGGSPDPITRNDPMRTIRRTAPRSPARLGHPWDRPYSSAGVAIPEWARPYPSADSPLVTRTDRYVRTSALTIISSIMMNPEQTPGEAAITFAEVLEQCRAAGVPFGELLDQEVEGFGMVPLLIELIRCDFEEGPELLLFLLQYSTPSPKMFWNIKKG